MSQITRILLVLAGLVPAGAPAAQAPDPLQRYGSPGAGRGVFLPTFHTDGEFPVLGNGNFHVTAGNLPGGAPGTVVIAQRKANLSLLGINLLVDPVGTQFLPAGASGSGLAAGTGEMKLGLPLPSLQALTCAPLHLQGIFLESANSFLWTSGLEIHCQSGWLQARSVIHDRLAYRRFVTAAPLGALVWNANAVPGFTYVKTEQSTCGGESHWMIIVKDDRYSIEFVLVPGGSLRMGDFHNQAPNNRHQYEIPIHHVRLGPFLVARTEVTQAQWTAVMASTPWANRTYLGPTKDCAANYISWNGADAFCRTAGWRLPAEAEWEYACRAGTTTVYSFGNSSANFGQYGWDVNNTWYANEKYPHPAGAKLPNAFGLHDMHGNLFEWVRDRWHDNYDLAPTDGSAWTGSTSPYWVFRGGSWYQYPVKARSAHRWGNTPGQGFFDCGFRPARSL